MSKTVYNNSRKIIFSLLVFFFSISVTAQQPNCGKIQGLTELAAQDIDLLIDPLAEKPSLSHPFFLTESIDPEVVYPVKDPVPGFGEQYIYATEDQLYYIFSLEGLKKEKVAGKAAETEKTLAECWKQKGWLKEQIESSEYRYFYRLNTGKGEDLWVLVNREESQGKERRTVVLMQEPQ